MVSFAKFQTKDRSVIYKQAIKICSMLGLVLHTVSHVMIFF